jgi:hypothetical protein
LKHYKARENMACPLRFNIDAYSAIQHFCRRSGQRSRVRKLQYIAELERTVDSLQVIMLIFYFTAMAHGFHSTYFMGWE